MVLKAPDTYVYQGPPNDLLNNFMRDVPSTIHMFYNTVKYCGHRPAQKYNIGSSYMTLTYQEFAERVENFGQGFMALGLKKGDRISIMAPTNPIWDWADYGGRAAGCAVNTIYPDDSSETIIYTTNHSESSCICVHNKELLEKILKNLGRPAQCKTYRGDEFHLPKRDQKCTEHAAALGTGAGIQG